MSRRPPRSPLFPSTPLSRSIPSTLRQALDNSPGSPPLSTVDQLPRLYRLARAYDEQSADDLVDRKSTRLNSSHANISYAVFCLKKKNIIQRLSCCTSRKYDS